MQAWWLLVIKQSVPQTRSSSAAAQTQLSHGTGPADWETRETHAGAYNQAACSAVNDEAFCLWPRSLMAATIYEMVLDQLPRVQAR